MKNTSKKKRYTKKYRLGSSATWIREFEGKNIVKEYSRWYGVDLICAIKELREKGVIIDAEYERRIEEKRIEQQINKENRKKNKKERQDDYSDSRFAFIVGYTSGGAAYGITHEEMEEIKIGEDFEGLFED